jgi:hypothetical protein
MTNRRRWMITFFTAALTSVLPAGARAQDTYTPEGDPPPKPTHDEGPTTRHWYGWQTLLVDGAALGFIAAGLSKGEYVLFGVGTYLVGPPIVHATHGRADAAFGSFGVRLLLPPTAALLFGFGLGAAACPRESSGDCTGSMALAGFVSAMAVATTLDAALFAIAKEQPSSASLTVVPVGAQHGTAGAELRALGRF